MRGFYSRWAMMLETLLGKTIALSTTLISHYTFQNAFQISPEGPRMEALQWSIHTSYWSQFCPLRSRNSCKVFSSKRALYRGHPALPSTQVHTWIDIQELDLITRVIFSQSWHTETPSPNPGSHGHPPMALAPQRSIGPQRP